MRIELENVTYETGMLLKKYGFDELCELYFSSDFQYEGRSISFEEQLDLISAMEEDKIVEIKGGHIGCHANKNSCDWMDDDTCSAPTLPLVEKWFRDKHGIIIQIRYAYKNNGDVEYTFSVTDTKTRKMFDCRDYFTSHEKAEDKAIEYAIEHHLKEKEEK